MRNKILTSALGLGLLIVIGLGGCADGGSGAEPSGGSLTGGLSGRTAGYGGGAHFRAVEIARLNREELRSLTQALGGMAMGMPADAAFEAAAAAASRGEGGASRAPLVDADTNDDGIVTPDEVLGMVRTGYSQDEIVAALERTDAAFVLTPMEVDQLAAARVPASLIQKLRRVSREQRAELVREGRARAAASVTTP